jgi:hypothetical protein
MPTDLAYMLDLLSLTNYREPFARDVPRARHARYPLRLWRPVATRGRAREGGRRFPVVLHGMAVLADSRAKLHSAPEFSLAKRLLAAIPPA